MKKIISTCIALMVSAASAETFAPEKRVSIMPSIIAISSLVKTKILTSHGVDYSRRRS